MKEVQVAIAIATNGGLRCFYIFEDNPSQALHMLRAAFPNLKGNDVKLYPPLNEAAAKALILQPGEVLEWHIGKRINAASLIDPLTNKP